MVWEARRDVTFPLVQTGRTWCERLHENVATAGGIDIVCAHEKNQVLAAWVCLRVHEEEHATTAPALGETRKHDIHMDMVLVLVVHLPMCPFANAPP